MLLGQSFLQSQLVTFFVFTVLVSLGVLTDQFKVEWNSYCTQSTSPGRSIFILCSRISQSHRAKWFRFAQTLLSCHIVDQFLIEDGIFFSLKINVNCIGVDQMCFFPHIYYASHCLCEFSQEDMKKFLLIPDSKNIFRP